MLQRLTGFGRKVWTSVRNLISVADPALSRLFGFLPSFAGVEVNESSTLGISAVWRAVNLISHTLAQLPLRTQRDTGDGMTQVTTSFLDNPGMSGVLFAPISVTPFRWKQMVLSHVLLHGDAFLRHIYGGGGQLVGLEPIHPLSVEVYWPTGDERPAGGKWFRVLNRDGSIEVHDASSLLQVMGFTIDGLRGVSPITMARTSLGTAIAGDRAAAKMFSSGAAVAGLVTPDDEWATGDAAVIKAEVNDAMTGWENAGGVAVVNRKVKFTQLSMSAVDAQFLQSRQFSIEEVARWFGVPPFELMQTDKQTSWGTGIEAQQRGLGRTTLAPWATCLEEALSTLLPRPRAAVFDFTDLERPSPDVQQGLVLARWESGAATLNETRIALHLPPVPGGDVLKGQPAADPAQEGAPTNA